MLSHPVFNVVETWARLRWPKSNFVTKEYPLSIGKKRLNLSVNLLRLSWRTGFVVITTLLAMALPFFNEILALLGALAYWPLTVFFPVEMYISQNKINRQSLRWLGHELLNLVCFLVTIGMACSAIQGLSQGLQTHKPFKF